MQKNHTIKQKVFLVNRNQKNQEKINPQKNQKKINPQKNLENQENKNL